MTILTVVLVSCIIVLAVLMTFSSVAFYAAGKIKGAKDALLSNAKIGDEMTRVVDHVLAHTASMTSIWQAAMSQKDVIIDSLTKENAEFRSNLQEAVEHAMGDDIDDEDVEEEGSVEEASSEEIYTTFNRIVSSSVSPAHVALDLHTKLENIKGSIKTARNGGVSDSILVSNLLSELEKS